MSDLASHLGPIDIYLLDQILRGRITPGMRIFDAGCGGGRNLVYLLREGYDVWGADADGAAVDAVRALAERLAPELPPENFRQESLAELSLPDAHADVVVVNAVLHFAGSDEEFAGMLEGCWRLLRPGGVFFSRLASSIGIESQVRVVDGRCCRLPDGSLRYLVDEELLMDWTRRLGGELLDPLKTTVVQQQRAMTTWVMRRAS